MAFLNIAPTGTVLPFAGSTAPEGWAICNGAAINRTNYAALFAVVGTTYGTGDGSITFNLPDMQGVFPRGSGTNNTTNYGGATGHTPAGGALANKGRQRTAPNNMTSGFTGSAVTGGSATSSGIDHNHYAGQLSGQINLTSISQSSTGWAAVNVGARDSTHTTSGATAFNHTHPVTATSAGSTSLSSTDTETTPAFLALNYIIKL